MELDTRVEAAGRLRLAGPAPRPRAASPWNGPGGRRDRVDFLAVGAITHSAPSLDIALDWEEVVPLAVDVGNTEITIGVFQGDELAQHWRAS